MGRKTPPPELQPAHGTLRGEAAIDVTEIEARIGSRSRQTIIEIIDKHPDEALAVLRAWLRRSS